MLDKILERLKDLELTSKGVKASVKNMRIMAQIKSDLQNLILTKEYKSALKDFMQVFNEIDKFQTQYFEQTEKKFTPSKVLAELKKQTIIDVTDRMTERGIVAQVTDSVSEILRRNISTGSSYATLTKQLRELLAETKTGGIFQRYAKQITTDAVNQYSASNLRTISSDLGYEWFRYAGKDIDTTRPFCDAMTDLEYFHVSQIPDLIKAKNLYYVKDGKEQKVPVNPNTGLPAGMIPGTDASSFFVNRGGYNCGHQILPVIERLVPAQIKNEVFATSAYRSWASLRG
jgi:hypothetical protein